MFFVRLFQIWSEKILMDCGNIYISLQTYQFGIPKCCHLCFWAKHIYNVHHHNEFLSRVGTSPDEPSFSGSHILQSKS